MNRRSIARNVQKGFTLIELMIVVAIIGILAAVALPAYQDYTVRAKVTEVMLALGNCKTSVTEYYTSNNAMPATLAAAGCSSNATKFVSSVAVTATTGAVVGTIQGTGSAADTTTLTLQPTTDAGRTGAFAASPTTPILGWSCGGSSSAAYKFLPANCRQAALGGL
ncbi:pilin [Variovorax sp. RTB1]|uniref:pilin n=1 Tax=Variovorax sp. RTB1 TaxID=3048631 RepID=UPI002B2236E2|nr:pilin [Variovorax sp. RTB1]MEB0111020.1 pilin [Variovorax sp. RTB1]